MHFRLPPTRANNPNATNTTTTRGSRAPRPPYADAGLSVREPPLGSVDRKDPSARVRDVYEGALRSDEEEKNEDDDEYEYDTGRCRGGAGDGKYGGSGAQIPRGRRERGRGRITGKVMSNDGSGGLDGFGVLCEVTVIVAHAPLGRVV